MLYKYIFVLIISLISTQATAIEKAESKKLTMCVTHFPPYQVVVEGEKPIGENIAATTHLFSKLGFTINFMKANSFWRCMAMLKTGKADLMSGLLDAPERREFAHLLAYGSLDKKIFYVNKKNANISTFSQLKGLRIAVLREVKQFSLFDNAPDGFFTKVAVSDLDAAFRVLAADRLDVVISTDFFDLEKFKNGVDGAEEIVEISVAIEGGSLLFTALSKKSQASQFAPELNALAKEMFKTGEFQKIIDEFKIKHPEYYLKRAE